VVQKKHDRDFIKEEVINEKYIANFNDIKIFFFVGNSFIK
jgi:hypothetical protein